MGCGSGKTVVADIGQGCEPFPAQKTTGVEVDCEAKTIILKQEDKEGNETPVEFTGAECLFSVDTRWEKQDPVENPDGSIDICEILMEEQDGEYVPASPEQEKCHTIPADKNVVDIICTLGNITLVFADGTTKITDSECNVDTFSAVVDNGNGTLSWVNPQGVVVHSWDKEDTDTSGTISKDGDTYTWVSGSTTETWTIPPAGETDTDTKLVMQPLVTNPDGSRSVCWSLVNAVTDEVLQEDVHCLDLASLDHPEASKSSVGHGWVSGLSNTTLADLGSTVGTSNQVLDDNTFCFNLDNPSDSQEAVYTINLAGADGFLRTVDISDMEDTDFGNARVSTYFTLKIDGVAAGGGNPSYMYLNEVIPYSQQSIDKNSLSTLVSGSISAAGSVEICVERHLDTSNIPANKLDRLLLSAASSMYNWHITTKG